MEKLRIIEISIALSLIVSVVASIFSFGAECNKVRNEVVRLHILANSDSEEDQEVKLKVRDALLNSGDDLFNGKTSKENVEDIISRNEIKIKNIINNVLNENGFAYKSELYVVNEFFDSREYDGFVMPAGQYKALKIVLGNGQGHNWWCVMFPPLCLPAATENESLNLYFSEKGTDIITNGEKYIVKFKIIELYERVKEFVKQNK